MSAGGAAPRSAVLASTCLLLVASSLGCRDISRFSSAGDHYEGSVVKGDFVRAEARRLRALYPKVEVAPLLYRIEDDTVALLRE